MGKTVKFDFTVDFRIGPGILFGNWTGRRRRAEAIDETRDKLKVSNTPERRRLRPAAIGLLGGLGRRGAAATMRLDEGFPKGRRPNPRPAPDPTWS